MLGISKNKQKKIENIKTFDDAIDAIKFFIAVYEWQHANEAIEELKNLEKQSYLKLNESLNENDDYSGKEINKQKKIFEKKILIIGKIEDEYKIKKEKYDVNIDKERFKIRFEQIKTEIENLIHSAKAKTALGLLQNFLEENNDKKIVVNFFNYEKKKIQKAIIDEEIKEEKKYKQNTKMEALKLIGKTTTFENDNIEKTITKKNKKNIFEIFNLYHKIKQKLKRKKLLDEVNLLIEENSKVKDDIAKQKLETLHKGLTKEISQDNLVGYNLFGKILGADKMIGDTFGFFENKDKYNFFIGDATGDGVRAGFIITLMNRLFNTFVAKSDFNKLVFEINNGLKQDLKSRNFITAIFFEILKKEKGIIKFIGMGHEAMLVYRREEKKLEIIIPGGLAAGIRIIQNENDIKNKEIKMSDGDILLTYSDGLISPRKENGEHFDIKRLSETFLKAANLNSSPQIIYDYLIKDIKKFFSGEQFNDDVTILILQRDEEKDIIEDKEEFIKGLKVGTGINKSDLRKIKGITKEEIEKELREIEKEKKTQNIVKILSNLYYTGEVLKLKQEAIKYIKEGYIDKKINFYLKKAIENEQKYKIEQKEQRLSNKYNILKELLKKGDYKTVINEAENIISKDGNI